MVEGPGWAKRRVTRPANMPDKCAKGTGMKVPWASANNASPDANSITVLARRNSPDARATTSIGRSLHTTRDGQVSFVHKVSNDEWWLTLLDPNTKQQKRLVRMPRRVEDYSWTPDGIALIGEGSVLKSFDPQRGGEWETVADLAQYGLTGITRLSVSPRGDAVAVVAVPASPGRGKGQPR